MMIGAKRKRTLSKLCIHAILIIYAIFTLIPFYWMAVNSIRPSGDFYSRMEGLFPDNVDFGNYISLFANTNFLAWLWNSIIICVLSTLLGLLICSMAGFAFGVYRFRMKSFFFWLVLGSVAIPEIVTIIPVFRLMSDIGMIDTYSSLVLPYAVSMFGIFLMKQYIESSLPMELLEAARIDGIGEAGLFVRIALPLVKPGLGVLGIYLWLNAWSSYFWPLIMLKSQTMLTVPLGLATLYADPWNLQYGVLMAGSLISTIPIIIIFICAQDQFINGLTAGSVKG